MKAAGGVSARQQAALDDDDDDTDPRITSGPERAMTRAMTARAAGVRGRGF